jgi:hypothetical protein
MARNECLAGPCGERQQGTGRPALRGTARDFLEYCSNGRVLKIAPLTLAAGIAREQRFRNGLFE